MHHKRICKSLHNWALSFPETLHGISTCSVWNIGRMLGWCNSNVIPQRHVINLYNHNRSIISVELDGIEILPNNPIQAGNKKNPTTIRTDRSFQLLRIIRISKKLWNHYEWEVNPSIASSIIAKFKVNLKLLPTNISLKNGALGEKNKTWTSSKVQRLKSFTSYWGWISSWVTSTASAISAEDKIASQIYMDEED